MTIANRAKAKAFDRMGFVFGTLIAAFAPMGADMAEVVLLIIANLIVEGITLYYRFASGPIGRCSLNRSHASNCKQMHLHSD